MGRLRDSRGQTATEYLGVLVVVAALCAVLVAFAPQLGGSLSQAVRATLCAIAGQACDAPQQQASPWEPSQPCIVSSSNREGGLSVTVFSGKLGGKISYLRARRSDGSTAITVKGNAEAGLEFKLGEQASADLGNLTVGEGASGAANIVGQGEASRTWVFPNDKAADDFVSHASAWVRDNAIGSVPIGGWIYNQFSSGQDWKFPPAEETSFALGAGAGVKGEAGGGTGYIQGNANVSAAVGGTYNHRTHEKTLFFRVNGEAAADGGVQILAGLGVNGKGTGTAALTFDEHNHPVRLVLKGVAGYEGNLQNLARWKSLADVSDGLRKAKLVARDGEGNRVEFDAELDLTKPENRDAALAFVHGINPLTGDPVSGALAARDLIRRIDEDAKLDVRTYRTNSFDVGANASVGLGVDFGFEGAYKSGGAVLTGASYRVPGVGFVPWTRCGG